MRFAHLVELAGIEPASRTPLFSRDYSYETYAKP